LKQEDVARVETLVNEYVGRKLPVYAEEAAQEQALKINGLRAVFGEKYPPMVRIVSIGVRVGDLLAQPENTRWREYSIEFCGGTHLTNTGEVERFVITSEESVSKGVRRLVALAGQSAHAATEVADELARQSQRAKLLPESELPGAINALQKQSGADNVPLLARRRAQAAVAELQDKLKKWEKAQKASGGSLDVAAIAAGLLANSCNIAGGKLIVAEIPGANSDQLRSLLDSIRKRQPSVAALVVACDASKLSFVTAVSEDLIARGLKAGDWVKEAAKITGGGGGGSPQMGQAGGKDPAKLADALAAGKQVALAAIRG
jgi:alanyl-tRNA synthetase